MLFCGGIKELFSVMLGSPLSVSGLVIVVVSGLY